MGSALKSDERKAIKEAEDSLLALKGVTEAWDKRLDPQKQAVAILSGRVKQLESQGKKKDAERLASVLGMFVASVEALDATKALRSQENKATVDVATSGLKTYAMRMSEDERSAKFAMGIALSLQQYSKTVSGENDESGIFKKALSSYAKGDLEAGNRSLDEGMGSFFDKDIQRVSAIMSASGVHEQANRLLIERWKLFQNRDTHKKTKEDPAEKDPAYVLLYRIVHETDDYLKQMRTNQALTPEQMEAHEIRVAGWLLAIALLNRANDGVVEQAKASSRFSGSDKAAMVKKFEDNAANFIAGAKVALDSAPKLERSAFEKKMNDLVTGLFEERVNIISNLERFPKGDTLRNDLLAIASVQRNTALLLASPSGPTFEQTVPKSADVNFGRMLAAFFHVSDSNMRRAIYITSLQLFSNTRELLVSRNNQEINDLLSTNRTTTNTLDQQIHRNVKASEAFSSLKTAANLGVSMFIPIYGIAYMAYNIREGYQETGTVNKTQFALTVAGAIPLVGSGARLAARSSRWAKLVSGAERTIGLTGLAAGSVIGGADAYTAYRDGRGIDAIMSSFVLLFPVAHMVFRPRTPANIVPARRVRPSKTLEVRTPAEATTFDLYMRRVRREMGGGSVDLEAAERQKLDRALDKRARGETRSAEEEVALRTHDAAEARRIREQQAAAPREGAPAEAAPVKAAVAEAKGAAKVAPEEPKAAVEPPIPPARPPKVQKIKGEKGESRKARQTASDEGWRKQVVERNQWEKKQAEALRQTPPDQHAIFLEGSIREFELGTPRALEIMKVLYRRVVKQSSKWKEGSNPGLDTDACNLALMKIYSYENVRRAVAADPSMEAIRNHLEGPKGLFKRTGSAFPERLQNVPPTSDELWTMRHTIERETADLANSARVRLAKLKNEVIPKLEAKGKTKKLDEARKEVRKLEDTIRTKEPIKETERLFGISGKLNADQKMEMFRKLIDLGILREEAYVEFEAARSASATAKLGAIPTNGNLTLEQMQVSLKGRVGKSGDYEAELLNAMRNPDALNAIEAAHGPAVRTAYENIVNHAQSAKEAVESLNGKVPKGLSDGIKTFNDQVMKQAADDFALLERIAPHAERVRQMQMTEGSVRGRRSAKATKEMGKKLRQEAKERTKLEGKPSKLGRAARSVGSWMYNPDPEKGIVRNVAGHLLSNALFPFLPGYIGYRLYGRYSAGVEREQEAIRKALDEIYGIKSLRPELMAWANTTQGTRFLAHFPYTYPNAMPQEGKLVEELKNKTKIPSLSRINDMLADAKAFDSRLDAINALLRRKRQNDPDADAELQKVLGQLKIRPEAVTALLETKHADKLQIEDVYSLKMEDWDARKILTRYCDVISGLFLRPLIGAEGLQYDRATYEKMVEFLSDNPYVFLYLWKSFRAGEIPAAKLGNAINALRTMVNPDIYKSEGGTIVRDADGNKVVDKEKIENLLAIFRVMTHAPGTSATGEKAVFETGIARNSLLAVLDSRTARDLATKKRVNEIIDKYKDDNDALVAFNAFILEPPGSDKDFKVIKGDDIYGDPMALADLIAANAGKKPAELLAMAKEKGFVGPAYLGDIDPSLRTVGVTASGLLDMALKQKTISSGTHKKISESIVALNPGIRIEEMLDAAAKASFITMVERNQLSGLAASSAISNSDLVLFATSSKWNTGTDKAEQGVLKWVKKYRDNISGNGNLSHILQDMRDATDGTKVQFPKKTPMEIEDYATKSADIYKKNGWWVRGFTPSEEKRNTANRQVEGSRNLPKGSGAATKKMEPPPEVTYRSLKEGLGSENAERLWKGDKVVGVWNIIGNKIDEYNEAPVEGRMMKKVLALKEYENDLSKLKDDINGQFYRMFSAAAKEATMAKTGAKLTDEEKADAARCKSWGLVITGSGESMEVKYPKGKDFIEKELGTYIRNYISAKSGIKLEAPVKPKRTPRRHR